MTLASNGGKGSALSPFPLLLRPTTQEIKMYFQIQPPHQFNLNHFFSIQHNVDGFDLISPSGCFK